MITAAFVLVAALVRAAPAAADDPPANDAFEDSVRIDRVPTTLTGTARGATYSGEPPHTGLGGVHAWYRFSPPTTGKYSVLVCAPTLSSLAAFVGPTGDAVDPQAVTRFRQ